MLYLCWQWWALPIVVHFVILSHHLTCGQNWLIDHILPHDYNPNQIPVETSDTLLIINSTIQLRSLSSDQDQRVKFYKHKIFSHITLLVSSH